MFLSSRWGKPSYEIESLPLSEFNKQKLFHEHCSWGGIDDIMALHHQYYVMAKGGKKIEIVKVKKLAMYTSAAKAFVVESTKTIRNAFMSIAKMMKERK
jgi:L-fucose mutarotase/ribose pyranase (RbsD/FucU family)